MSRTAAFDVEQARLFHARRETARREAREVLRERRLAEAREAIRGLAPAHPGLRAVYLFGSILKPGRFSDQSDIDVAVDCDDVETESRFFAALDQALGGIVDLRPRKGGVADAVEFYGERVYAREADPPRA